MSVFYVAASLAGAFSGLLAYGIEKLDGRSGLAGWQWIFLIEGLIPVGLSLIIWKVLPDSPETAKFLTQPERDLLVRRLQNDSHAGQGKTTNNDKINKQHILAGLSDWKIWAATVCSSGKRMCLTFADLRAGHFLGKHCWSLRVRGTPPIAAKVICLSFS